MDLIDESAPQATNIPLPMSPNRPLTDSRLVASRIVPVGNAKTCERVVDFVRKHIPQLTHLRDDVIISKWLSLSEESRRAILGAFVNIPPSSASYVIDFVRFVNAVDSRKCGVSDLDLRDGTDRGAVQLVVSRPKCISVTIEANEACKLLRGYYMRTLEGTCPSPSVDSYFLRNSIATLRQMGIRALSSSGKPSFKRPRALCSSDGGGLLDTNRIEPAETSSALAPPVKRRRTNSTDDGSTDADLNLSSALLQQSSEPSRVSLGNLLSPTLHDGVHESKDVTGQKANTKYRIQRALQRLEFRKISQGAYASIEAGNTKEPMESAANGNVAETNGQNQAEEVHAPDSSKPALKSVESAILSATRDLRSSTDPGAAKTSSFQNSDFPMAYDFGLDQNHVTDSVLPTSHFAVFPSSQGASNGAFLYQWPQIGNVQERQHTSTPNATHAVVPLTCPVSLVDPSRTMQPTMGIMPGHSSSTHVPMYQHAWATHTALNQAALAAGHAMMVNGTLGLPCDQYADDGTRPPDLAPRAPGAFDPGKEALFGGQQRARPNVGKSAGDEKRIAKAGMLKSGVSASAEAIKRLPRFEILHRMASLNYEDPVVDGRHAEQWAAIALHVLKKYEIMDDTDLVKSKSFVRLCVFKKEVRAVAASTGCARITINHLKEVFTILGLPVSGEWDRRGHGGKRGPYVYGIRAKENK